MQWRVVELAMPCPVERVRSLSGFQEWLWWSIIYCCRWATLKVSNKCDLTLETNIRTSQQQDQGTNAFNTTNEVVVLDPDTPFSSRHLRLCSKRLLTGLLEGNPPGERPWKHFVAKVGRISCSQSSPLPHAGKVIAARTQSPTCGVTGPPNFGKNAGGLSYRDSPAASALASRMVVTGRSVIGERATCCLKTGQHASSLNPRVAAKVVATTRPNLEPEIETLESSWRSRALCDKTFIKRKCTTQMTADQAGQKCLAVPN